MATVWVVKMKGCWWQLFNPWLHGQKLPNKSTKRGTIWGNQGLIIKQNEVFSSGTVVEEETVQQLAT